MRTMNLVLKLEIIDVLKTSLSLVKDLTAKDIVNESYVLWITKPRKKTNEVFSIPIIPPAARIIEKYKTLANSKLLGNALPVKSNQKMNDYLKEIGQLAFINKKQPCMLLHDILLLQQLHLKIMFHYIPFPNV